MWVSKKDKEFFKKPDFRVGADNRLWHFICGMKHIPDHIKVLIQKCLDGANTPEEKKLLDEWYYSFSPEEMALLPEETETEIGKRIKNRLDEYVFYEKRATRHRKRFNFARAAAILSIIGIASLLYYVLTTRSEGKKITPAVTKSEPVKDIAPGSNKAILTLGDGSTLILDSTANGQLGTQGNAKLIKLDNGQLKYLNKKGDGYDAVVYNSITTPRGGQYQVILSDGSKIWLNASSSLRFPTEFKGDKREVEISGEAYFEIAHDKAKPFRVKVKDVEVQVLGTHFNVMAYDNESSIKTTLLEGALRVSNTSASALIAPGQQVALNKQGSFRLVSNADVDEAVAWKNGKFVFNSADIYSIMRQVERWYNVDVSFERTGDLHFSGQLGRYENVSELLRKLELTNEVHFRIEKGRIVVLP